MGKRRWAICMGAGFPEGMALCRCRVSGASFFLRETLFSGDTAVADGKRIRRENLCCPRPPPACSRMTPAPKSFLVRCRCAADVAVRAGQAGERIACPGCGGPLDVPRLRDLELLPAAAAPAPVARPWNAAHGCVVAGIAVAAVATLAAAGVPVFGGRSLPPVVPDAVIRDVVMSADDADVYRAWRAVRRSGVNRLATDDEMRRQFFARSSGNLSAILWGIAAAGAALATGGGVLLVRGLRSAEGPPS